MPWAVNDVNRFKKGLSDEQKKKWVEVANAILAEQLKKGKKKLEAEVIAIKTANARFSDTKNKAISFTDLEKTDIAITLAEASTNDDGYQLVLPRGTTYDSWYGELIFTKSFADAMVANQDRLKNTKPFLNEQHDRGKACAWALDMRSTDEGLEVKWDFTELGKSLVEGRIYKYFSAEIGGVTDVDTGDWVYPVFRGCALTNSPVMKNLPEVHLQEVTFKEETDGGKTVDFELMLSETANLSDEQKAKLAEALGIVDLSEKLKAKDEVITSLNEKITDLEGELAKFEADKIEATLSDALKTGKIKPVDKEKWEKRLSDDFDTYAEILNELEPKVNMDSTEGSELDDETHANRKLKFEDFTGRKEGIASASRKPEDYI